jgi:hypothetical protein
VAAVWGDDARGSLRLVPNYREGYITVVRDEDWEGSAAALALQQLDEDVAAAAEEETRRVLQRARSAAVFDGKLAGGRAAIPPDLVWMLQTGDDGRDVTVVPLERELEFWPTLRWYQYLRGEVARD